jgi:hypothetical protein
VSEKDVTRIANALERIADALDRLMEGGITVDHKL